MAVKKIMALAGVLLSSHAMAESSQNFSRWEYYNGTTNLGHSVCGVSSIGKGHTVVKNIVVKHIAGKDWLTVALYKDTWNIPTDTNITVTFDFMKNQPLTVAGVGYGKAIDVQLPTEATAAFLLAMADGPFMQVGFPGGKEPTWTISLKNVKPQILKFGNCMKHELSSRSATQPF